MPAEARGWGLVGVMLCGDAGDGCAPAAQRRGREVWEEGLGMCKNQMAEMAGECESIAIDTPLIVFPG